MCLSNNPTAFRPNRGGGINKTISGTDLLQVLVNIEAMRDDSNVDIASYTIKQIADLLGIDVEKENEIN